MRLNVLPKEFGEGRISMTRLKSNANGTAMQNESLGLFDGYTSYINIYIFHTCLQLVVDPLLDLMETSKISSLHEHVSYITRVL